MAGYLTPEQLQALMSLSGAGDQQAMLTHQLAQAQDLGRPSQQQYSTPAGALGGGIAGLADTLGSQLGQYRARQGLQALQGQRQAARGMFLGAMDAPTPTPAWQGAPFFGPGGESPEQAAPRQAAAETQARTRLESAGLMSGDPAIRGLIEDRRAAPERALKLTMLGEAEKERARLAGPASGLQRALAGRLLPGFPVDPNATAGELDRAAPLMEKAGAAEQMRAARADSLRLAASNKDQAGLEKRLQALKDDLDPNKRTSGALLDNQKRVNAAGRLESLGTDALGNPQNLDRRQMEELAIGLQNMLSGGGSSVEQVKQLVPDTIRGNAQKFVEWLSNEPTGTNQRAFVARMLETVRREKAVASDQLKRGQAARISAHVKTLREHPEDAMGVLDSYGFTPEEIDMQTGKYTPKAVAAGGGSPVAAHAHPEAAAALQWAKDNPSDPAAKEILSRLGAR